MSKLNSEKMANKEISDGVLRKFDAMIDCILEIETTFDDPERDSENTLWGAVLAFQFYFGEILGVGTMNYLLERARSRIDVLIQRIKTEGGVAQ